MENIFQLFPTIGCIAVICFVLCEFVKQFSIATKWVPVVSAVSGGILGVVGMKLGISELAGISVLDAIATGICSGLVASGGYSFVKNVSGAIPSNELSKKEQDALVFEEAVTAEVEARTAAIQAEAEAPKEG